MIVIGLVGGVGNQMFIYALYEALKAKGKEVYFDLSFFNESDNMKHRIDNFIDLELPEIDRETVVRLRDCSRNIFSRVSRKILGISKAKIYQDKEIGYQPEVFELDDYYLQGFWQSERYFYDIRDEIRSKYIIKDLMNDYQRKTLAEIESNNSVGIHIRRGDYLELSGLFGGICTEKYYEEAINRLKDMNCRFYIFSNDYEYAKAKYSGEEFTVVRPVDTFPESNMDLLLMSKCKHNIIATSSFSWWAAWLNNNHDKIVIAPDKWLNKPIKDVQCSDWIRVEG